MKDKSPENKPCRNLTEAFEALCVVSPEETTKEEKTDGISNVVSPTSVQEIHTPGKLEYAEFPVVELHNDIQLDLSDSCVNRISCYTIIHDINKEATSMAAHDPVLNLELEANSALVRAGQGNEPILELSTAEFAVIDEEKWLLNVIDHRVSKACPATFLMAMGEKEYETPVVLGTARTQLWKPSRSWWEAKSGKNPWIEPSSHNKRWRYLWPLIHYHKFLAKCIKKLKRNGVDVKSSRTPVSVFLREEVCEVSDHLAAVSLFESDEWMSCLEHFNGWTSTTDAAVLGYRYFISSLPLRGFTEPGDVDSPLLRSQIDEAFLRTMEAQREQLRNGTAPPVSVASSKTANKSLKGPPPTYPRTSPQVPRQIHGVRRPRYYPNGWYGWENYPDTNSVHSELSANSYPQPPNMHYEMPHPMYHPAFYHHHHQSDHSASSGGYTMPHQYAGWVDPVTIYMMQQQHIAQQQQNSPSSPEGAEKSPFKYDPESSMSMSPYWSHLDQATMAMGLATPAKVSPTTPRRPKDAKPEFAANARPPLIRQTYYGDHLPSPATQFMMSPQANFAYNYGYGISPRRLQKHSERVNSPNTVETTPESESLEQTTT